MLVFIEVQDYEEITRAKICVQRCVWLKKYYEVELVIRDISVKGITPYGEVNPKITRKAKLLRERILAERVGSFEIDFGLYKFRYHPYISGVGRLEEDFSRCDHCEYKEYGEEPECDDCKSQYVHEGKIVTDFSKVRWLSGFYRKDRALYCTLGLCDKNLKAT